MSTNTPERGERDDKDCESDEIRELRKDLRENREALQSMRLHLDLLIRDQGLECVIRDVGGKIDKLIAPLEAFSPLQDLGEIKGAVLALRRSLKRPNFDAPPTNFGGVFDAAGNPKDPSKGSTAV